MPKLTCDISESLMQAVIERSARTGEPASHIVMSALADALEIEHSTLFQVSTSTALVRGLYDGVVRLGELKQHGDFGLGTFDGLDGEMLAFDGHFYHVQANGQVSQPADDARVPFAVVTAFHPDRRFAVERVDAFESLVARLDAERRTDNLFYAVRIDGQFTNLKTRAACKTASGVPLVEATSHQAEFQFSQVAGTIVGFWTPTYARTVNIAGWHLHFIDQRRSGGGHLFACGGSGLAVQMQELADLRIAIPETAAFLKADLTRDPSSDLAAAEGDQHRSS
jgi:acetolactate decarboxylase